MNTLDYVNYDFLSCHLVLMNWTVESECVLCVMINNNVMKQYVYKKYTRGDLIKTRLLLRLEYTRNIVN